MSTTIPFSCPNCDGTLVVPVAAAGKRVKCKHCQAIIAVPSATPAKPVAKPVAKAVPVVPPPPPPPAADANAPLKFKDDDEEDDNPNPYGVVTESDVPRCPHCATELDPPDTKVCLNCGYDMQTRQRHKSKKVYETTTQDVMSYQSPAYIWIVVLIALIVIDVLFWMNMESWMVGGFLDREEPNPATQRPQFLVGPNCFNVFYSVFLMFMMWFGLRVIIKKLIIQPKPTEIEKVKGDDDEDEEDGDDEEEEEDDEEEEDEEEDDEEEDERPKKKKR